MIVTEQQLVSRITHERRVRGLSKAAVARMIGESRQMVLNYENPAYVGRKANIARMKILSALLDGQEVRGPLFEIPSQREMKM